MSKENIIYDQEPKGLIYRASVPLFRENVSELHTEKDGRKFRDVEGAIVLDRRSVQEKMGWTDEEVSDHYTTFFEIDGFLTDVRKVNFDFRHHGVSTGAVGHETWIVDDYKIQIDDKTLIVPARMLSVKVYEDSMIRFKGRNGETIEDGNLLKNIENGRVFTWSIEFKPITQGTTRSGVTIYRSYHTPRISFLDCTQGIPDAGGFTLRNYLETDIISNNENKQLNSILSLLRKFTSNNQPMSKFKKGQELSRQVKAKITSDSTEKDGKKLYNVRIDDGDETEIDEDELTRLFGKPAEKPAAKAEGEDKDFDEETVKPNKKVNTDENEKVRALEEKIEALTNTVAELSEKQTKRSDSDSKTEDKKEDSEAKIAELETQLRLYKEKETATDSVKNLPKGSDSANIREGVDQSESATEPAPKPAYNDLLRKYATTN